MRKIRIRKSRHYGDKQFRKTVPFSVMAKGSNYFLFLDIDDKSKQRYKVTLIIFKGVTLIQMKKEELSGNISKFPPFQ